MEILLYLLVFISVTFIFIILNEILYANRRIVNQRMNTIETSFIDNQDTDELKKPFTERVIDPIYAKLVEGVKQITPAQISEKYENLITQAGATDKVSVYNLITVQLMFGLVLSIGLYLLQNMKGGSTNFLMIFIGATVGFVLPYSSLNNKAKKRRESIQHNLPDLLDLLYISVEAGLGFDSALKKSTDKMNGPLSDEFKKALNDIAKGRERQDALRNIVQRTGVTDLNTVITAIIQSEQLGTNISNTLRVQSETMRQKRRQRAEEAAAKLPIKMLFPLIFLIFPALFGVILGPALISVMDKMKDF